ncbi:hypothetical protein MWH25_10595 [Natroniella acetigena]|uniref:YkvI family membrane protein n=1 Tax=Natroniella acetigena TaxID=52004 RepID=UPI00200A14EA|nr:hypothetical protein [Natroniella acetigena]MCK8828180.1 hypothetical protein [Natroniella acetigena]
MEKGIESMKEKLVIPSCFGVAFVWFTTHFGGGFASGRQVAEFYVTYGWFAIFMPIIAMAINGLVFYYAWDFSVKHQVFDYKSWTDKFYSPYQKIFSNLYELVFVITMFVATAVGFATGGEIIEEALGTPYIINTLMIAVIIFLLTIFGAKLIRKVATIVAIALIIGVGIIYGTNAVVSFPAVMDLVASQRTETSFLAAAWRMLLYASFQALAVGAYVAVADALNDGEDVKKAGMIGFAINAILLTLASITVLAHYPEVLDIPVPTIYVVREGVGGAFAEGLISVLILFGAVSTGVNFVFGGVKRIVAWWPGEVEEQKERKRAIIASLIFVILTWCIALFGLIPLVARGYDLLGILGIPMIIIPVLYKLLLSKDAESTLAKDENI